MCDLMHSITMICLYFRKKHQGPLKCMIYLFEHLKIFLQLCTSISSGMGFLNHFKLHPDQVLLAPLSITLLCVCVCETVFNGKIIYIFHLFVSVICVHPLCVFLNLCQQFFNYNTTISHSKIFLYVCELVSTGFFKYRETQNHHL